MREADLGTKREWDSWQMDRQRRADCEPSTHAVPGWVSRSAAVAAAGDRLVVRLENKKNKLIVAGNMI